MKIKKIVCAVLLCAVLAMSFTTVSFAEEVTVKVDGKTLEMSVPARIENGRTLVPMRAIFEALGMEIEWDDETKTVTAKDNENEIVMTIGKKEIVKNGVSVKMDVAPVIRDSATLVPARAVSESLEASIEWDKETQTVEVESAAYQEIKNAWKDNIGTIDLTAMTVSGEGAAVEGNVVEITEGGDFTVTGTNADAMIHVNTKGRVKLRLSGVNLTNTKGPAIFYEQADKAFITITKNTENYIADGAEYTLDAKGAIYSAADIEIKGQGLLSVTSTAHHAIACKDDVKIEEGTLVLNAPAGDGIHANDKVKILGGNVTITADGDGIQAEENVVVEGGVINITTTGEVASSNNGFDKFGGGFRMSGGMQPPEQEGRRNDIDENRMQPKDRGFAGERPDGNMQPPEMRGENGMGERPNMPNGNMQPPEMNDNAEENSESTSSKGIKAGILITVSGGEINVNSTDHAVHSADAMIVSGGIMTLASEKAKGISSHGNLNITGGEINITKSTEGIESRAIMTISGGKISVTSSDDGINCGGTNGQDVRGSGSDGATEHDLYIKGGEIYVNAAGDGLDANGRIVISGGNIIVDGPSSNGNGALDSGNKITVSGGTLLAIGSSGMAEAPSASSTQASFSYTLSESYSAGTKITVSTESGKEIVSYTAVKTGNNVVFSSPELKVGETYTITVGEKSYSVELTSLTTNNGGFGGFGGGRGERGGNRQMMPIG